MAKPSATEIAVMRMMDRLQQITIGCTTTVRGVVVTRWTETRFELETWGVYQEDLDEAAFNLVDRTMVAA
jgi:hypothetical protein